MSVIERGILEVTADTSGVEAGMKKAERSIRNLGRVSQEQSQRQASSINAYVRSLEIQAATFGKTTREAELYRLRMRGASAAQLQAANTALSLSERQEHLAARLDRIRVAAAAFGVALGAAFAGAVFGIDKLVKSAAEYGDLATKMGDTPEAVASLAMAAADGNTTVSALVGASNQLAKSLTGVSDESKAAGAAVKAMGLDIAKLKTQSPVDQLTTIARAMDQFADGPEKAAAAMALFGRGGAEMLPALKALAEEGARVNILTNEQIALAKQYSDEQARMGAEIKATAQAIAIEAAPVLLEFMRDIRDLARDQELAAAAADVLRASMRAGVIVFKTIALVTATAATGFEIAGLKLGAIIAQMEALARLDFAGAWSIAKALDEDLDKARAKLRKFYSEAFNGSEQAQPGQDSSFQQLEDRRLGKGRARPRLPFDGAIREDSKRTAAERAAEQERKERLRAALADIKHGSDRQLSIFDQAEKLLEARRSASLIDEREYWEAKRAFLRLNADEQERALTATIARLQQEKVKGKDAIAQQREIAEAQAKIIQLRERAGTEAEIVNVREAESARKLANAYADAVASAREYLDTIARRNQREVEGVGRGERFRQQQQELNAIEDTFLKEKGRLDRELRRGDITREQFQTYLGLARSTYAEEVRLYQDRTRAIDQAQSEWANGFDESLANYLDNARDVAGETAHLFDGVFGTMEDAIVEFAKTGKLSIKSLFDDIAAQVSRFAARQIMADLLGGGATGSSGFIGSIAQMFSGQTMAAGPTTGDFARMDRLAGAAGEAVGAASTVAADAAQTAAITANTVAITAETAARTASAAAETAASAAIAAASASSAAAMAALAAAAGSASAALATVAASSAAGSGGSIIAALAGGRAIGGPVSAGSLYQVNERGPELLRVAGKQYLMVGASGDVRPVEGGTAQGTTIVQVNVTPPPASTRETAMQWGAAAGRHIRTALRRNG